MSRADGLYACVDVGTTRIKLNLYDSELDLKHSEVVTVPLSAEGLQDAEQLFAAVKHLLAKGKEMGAKSAGLATYRASTVAWDREGKPLTPIVTWTDGGVLSTYRRLPAYKRFVGKIPPFDLIISPSSTVMKFLRLRELNPNLLEGSMQWTIDAYLAYRLTGKFVSDATNACLTGIIDPRKMKEIGIVKSLFNLKSPIPEIVENAERIGTYDGLEINSLIGDQQAASVAEGALERGIAKVTNGTGTFVDVPTAGFARRGKLIPLVLLKSKGIVSFGVEGFLSSTGKVIDALLRVGFIKEYSELEVESNRRALFIPTLTNLQVPRVPQANEVIPGLEAGSDKTAVVGGLLKTIAFHVKSVLQQSGEEAKAIRADGGLSKSGALLRCIAAATGVGVERLADTEATSRGLAMLQLVAIGKNSLGELAKIRGNTETFSAKPDDMMEEEFEDWKKLTESFRSSKGSFPAA